MTTNVPPRRREGRAPGTRTGVVKLGLFKTIKCDVTDLSSSGAKLFAEDAADLPEVFDMSVRRTGKKHKFKCAKRWQEGNTIGVEFMTA